MQTENQSIQTRNQSNIQKKSNWRKSHWYQARVKGESQWVRTLLYDPVRDIYLCRSGIVKEMFYADELTDFCD